MKALEFKSKIKNNQIEIPSKFESELIQNKNIRVIILIEESDADDFKLTTKEQFLKGYDDSDSIYDNF